MNAKNALAGRNNKPNKDKKTIIFFVIATIIIFLLIISLVFAVQTDNSSGKNSLIKKQKDISINDKIIENRGKGAVRFNNEINVGAVDVEENPNVYVANNLIAINTEELPELNQPATIIFYNISLENRPAIYYNKGFTTNPGEITEPCPEDICSNISYDDKTGTLAFDVAHFTSFYAAPSWTIWPWRDWNWWPRCSSDAECVPTAYCAKFSACEAFEINPYYPYWKMEQCWYDPPAGTKTQHSLYARSYYPPDPWDGACAEGYARRLCTYGLDFGFIYGCYSDRVCARIEPCENTTCACEGTPACENGGNHGGSYCQPKVCDAGDAEVGKCYYEGDDYNPEQNVPIGGKICSNRQEWQVCSEEDGDPCGEWNVLEGYETNITTTDMYGLDSFDINVCAGNSPPNINVNINPAENPDVCTNLACKAEISDDCSGSFGVEYKITGGHGSLASTMPEITGTTICLGNPCQVIINIPKQYTLCDDAIKCEIKAKDGCMATSIQNSNTNAIKGVNACET
ncbi:MAG TPA: hypothetical protein VJA86_00285 [Candidatus Nanoarchaeia archaeon]|nr:hypothetical protein [Candidatus Nanoarchaeia archaeon]